MRLFNAQLMTVTENFRLPFDRLSQSTNKHSEFSSRSHESRVKKSQCKRTFKEGVVYACIPAYINIFILFTTFMVINVQESGTLPAILADHLRLYAHKRNLT